MRTKQIIRGFNNSEKIRVMIDGVGLYMTVGDISNIFATTNHRVAVWEVAERLALDRRLAFKQSGWTGVPSGLATTKVIDGVTHQVQVDLLTDSANVLAK